MKTLFSNLKCFALGATICLVPGSFGQTNALADTAATNNVPSTFSDSGSTNKEPAAEASSSKEEIPAELAAAIKARAEAPPAVENDLKSFRIIAERNIFNPNRFPRTSSGRINVPPPTKPVRVDTFSMVGMLSSEKGVFAFFDGNQSDYRKAAKEGDTIASFKVAQVGHDFVTLQAGDKETKLEIGMQMKKQDEGEWQVIDKSEPASSLSAPSSSSSSSSKPVTGDDDEVVRRMMQNREKESK